MLGFSFASVSRSRSGKPRAFIEALKPYIVVAASVTLAAAVLFAARALGHPLPGIPVLLLPVLVGAFLGGFCNGLFAVFLGLAVDGLFFREFAFPHAPYAPFSELALQPPAVPFLVEGVLLSFIGHWFRQFGQKNRDATEKQQALEQEIDRRRKLEEALLQSRRTAQAQLAEIEAIYATAPLALCRVDRELRFVHVNRAWSDIGGLSPEATLGRAIQEAMPELGEVLAICIRRVFVSGEPILEWEVCGTGPRDSVSERVWLASFVPLDEGAGDVAGATVVLREMTGQRGLEAALRKSEERGRLLMDRIGSAEQARREAEAENRRLAGLLADLAERPQAGEGFRHAERVYRAIGESMDYGVWIAAQDGRLMFASESFLALTGLDQARCAGFGWFDVLHPDERDRVSESWEQAVRDGKPWESEHRCRGVDGRWHPVLARGVPVRDDKGEVVGWAGTHLDIGRLKAAEEALREADRKKDEFLAVLVHELRNPLAPILTSAQLLRRRGLERPDLLESATGSIERQVKHLSQLIGELSDLSRIARGKIELKPEILELDTVIAQAVGACRPLIDKHRQKLVVDLPAAPLYVRADPARLAQVVGNLLHNAAKFTPVEGEIHVALGDDGQYVTISVRDEGIGIDPASLDRVFEPFVQIERPLHSGGHNGLGIGLALAKSLVEMQGGDISARSAGKGQGSEFIVRLPLAGG
jgi:PAS domain S-box-containing protein